MKLKNFFYLNILTLGLLICSGAISLIYMTNLLKKSAQKIQEATDSIYASEELEDQILRYQREDLLYEITRNSQNLENRKESHSAIQYWLSIVNQHAETLEEQDLVRQLTKDIQLFFTSFEELRDSGLKPSEVFRATNHERQRLDIPLRHLIEINLQQAEAGREETSNEQVTSVAVGVFLVILFAISTMILILHMHSQLYRPLIKFKKAVSQYRAGDLTARASEAGLAELADVSRGYNELISTLVRQREAQLNFLASVAHDLRNPLGAIRMSAQLISETQGPEDRKDLSVAALIERQTEKLDSLVTDLLDTARFEVGQFKLRFEEHDLRKSTREAVQLYQAITKQHRLELQEPQRALISRCDVVRISQVLNNLLSNAIKYSPHGGTIRVLLYEADNKNFLEIIDQGIGISQEDQTRIFEPFRRTRETESSIPGVGLGLSVVRRIIEAHKGTISVKSEIGKGSSFKICIPSTLSN